MPLYMDIHKIDGGVSADDVAEAHRKDVAAQKERGVNYRNYWVDEKAGRIFCLVEAPDAEARTEHIFQGDKGDRERNGRFDKFARQAEDAVSRKEQSHGMGHREGRGLEKQLTPRDAEKKEPEDKQDMIGSLRDDVMESEFQIHRELAGPRHGMRSVRWLPRSAGVRTIVHAVPLVMHSPLPVR